MAFGPATPLPLPFPTGTLITVHAFPSNMTAISAPTDRTCERCGRRDVWDEERHTWSIAVVDGEKQSGNPHCLHEWDINGTFNPIQQ